MVVNVWQLMGISQVSLERTSDQSFRGNDGAGTTGNVRYVYTDWGQDARNLAVVYADGAYDGKPFLTPLRAQSVMLLQSGAVQETDGRRYVTVRVDSFIHIDKIGVELVAKTVQPWLTKTADDNFVQTVDFLSTFSRTAERNPQGMRRLAARLRGVDEPTRGELVRLCFQTSQRYADDDAPRTAAPLVLAQQSALAADRNRVLSVITLLSERRRGKRLCRPASRAISSLRPEVERTNRRQGIRGAARNG